MRHLSLSRKRVGKQIIRGVEAQLHYFSSLR
jgi:hypothetical protein